MAKLARKMLLLAIKETTSGTEEVPSAANVMLVRAFTPSLITAEYVGRDNVKPYMGSNPQLATGIHRQFEFEVELAGSGTPGTPPAWANLLDCCGMPDTTNAGSPGEVHFGLISENLPTMTMYGYLDGIRFKLVGARGTCVFTMNSKAIPVMQFRFIGEYSIAEDVTFPTGISYSSFISPVTVGKVFSQSFTLHGVTVCMQSLSIDLANALSYRDLVGCGGPTISNRLPTATAVFELTTMAQKNWGETIKNSDSGSMQFIHGRSAGNILTFDAPAVTCSNATLQEADGISMLSVSLSLNPVLGDDELVLTVQ